MRHWFVVAVLTIGPLTCAAGIIWFLRGLAADWRASGKATRRS